MTTEIALRASAFQALHREGLLLLSNAWDPGSARLAVAAGGAAVATSSAALAWAQGYPDGDALPPATLLDTVKRICAAVDVPVTADIEGGYSDDPAEVGALVARLLDAGAVGINIEDGSAAPERLAAKIQAARETARARGIDLYINARTDVWLRGLAPAGARVDEALRRGALYAASGASGLFVPGATDAAEIGALVRGAGLPLNVMARPGLPAVGALRALGVRRLSAGSAIGEAVQGLALSLMRAFTSTGALEAGGAPALGYGALNTLMRRG